MYVAVLPRVGLYSPERKRWKKGWIRGKSLKGWSKNQELTKITGSIPLVTKAITTIKEKAVF